MNNVRICDECNGACELVVIKSKPQSSEWYCEHCHKSYPVEGMSDWTSNKRQSA